LCKAQRNRNELNSSLSVGRHRAAQTTHWKVRRGKSGAIYLLLSVGTHGNCSEEVARDGCTAKTYLLSDQLDPVCGVSWPPEIHCLCVLQSVMGYFHSFTTS
uniref:Uncharacterized protein n=1 Tax=Salarias fasciatus TaxID=181472 RepID=A0A672G3M0_SALFA